MGKNRESNEGNTFISIPKSIGNILVQNADLLDLPGWAVREVRNTDEHLLIEAERKEVPLSCPLCGSTRPPYHFGHRPRLVADLPIRMRPVQIRVSRRRYRCRDCAGTFLDELQGIHPRHDATERLVDLFSKRWKLGSLRSSIFSRRKRR
jgi:transposase